MQTKRKKGSSGGIKSFRRETAKKPVHECANCGCIRYTQCTCDRKGEKHGQRRN